jgi:hypothetical protein
MIAALGSAAAGALAAALVLVLGVPAAVSIVIGIAALVIVAGAIDYVRTH